MLDGLRIMSKNIVGRTILAIFAGVIVIGFGFWGIQDVFHRFRAGQLAVVGDEVITVQQYRDEYQTTLQRLQRQARRAITNEEARAAGLDREVLARLLTSAALDQTAKKLGLAVSDAVIAKTVKADKAFAGPDGKFSQARMDLILQDNGYTEGSFIREQRADILRGEIAGSIAGGLKPPKIMLAAINKYANQTRDADYFILPAPDAAKEPAPAESAVKAYYDANKSAYRTPEYRKVNVLTASPDEIAKGLNISDEAAKKVYDQTAAQRYTVPEKRDMTELTFSSREAAQKAKQRIDAGATFAAVAADKTAGGVLANLGTKTKASMFDQAIAKVAFALPKPGVAGPVKGQFGWTLVHVLKIDPGSTKSFDSVKSSIKMQLAASKAGTEAQTLHDKIEDLRSNGKTLAEAAKALGLHSYTYLVDSSGAGKGAKGEAGAPIPALAGSPDLLKAINASDVGVDNDAVPLKDGGYSWFEITAVVPSRQLTLAEVKSQVAKSLQQQMAQDQVANKAKELVKKIDSGAKIADLATANGVTVKKGEAVRRSGGAGLGKAAVAGIFATPIGGAGVAPADHGGRVVFKVTGAETPPLDLKGVALAVLMPKLTTSLQNEVFAQYVGGLQSKLGIRVNQTALATAEGSE